jgi:hypothetical protein
MSETGCWIRDAELNDAPELAVLMCELGYETKRPEMETRLKLILSNRAYKTFVAIMDGSVCGMIGTPTYPSYEHKPCVRANSCLGDIEHGAPPRDWPCVDCDCGDRFRSKRNPARVCGYTA